MNHHSPEMFTNTYLRVSVSKEITYDSVISSVSSYNSRGFQVTLEPHKDQGESYSSEFRRSWPFAWQIIQNNCVLDNKRIFEKGTILFTSLEQVARAIISNNLVHFHCFAASGYQKGEQKARSFENILFIFIFRRSFLHQGIFNFRHGHV